MTSTNRSQDCVEVHICHIKEQNVLNYKIKSNIYEIKTRNYYTLRHNYSLLSHVHDFWDIKMSKL